MSEVNMPMHALIFVLGGRQRVFILFSVIFSHLCQMTRTAGFWGLKLYSFWCASDCWWYKNRTWKIEVVCILLFFVYRTAIQYNTKFKRVLYAAVLRYHKFFIELKTNHKINTRIRNIIHIIRNLSQFGKTMDLQWLHFQNGRKKLFMDLIRIIDWVSIFLRLDADLQNIFW